MSSRCASDRKCLGAGWVASKGGSSGARPCPGWLCPPVPGALPGWINHSTAFSSPLRGQGAELTSGCRLGIQLEHSLKPALQGHSRLQLGAAGCLRVLPGAAELFQLRKSENGTTEPSRLEKTPRSSSPDSERNFLPSEPPYLTPE